MADVVLFEKQGPIGIIKLNRPPVNSYNHEMFTQFGRYVDEIRFDDSIKVAIITSALDGIFSAGADIRMLKESTPDYKAMFCLNCQETLNKIEATPKVFIAALNGTCVGGGLEIALAADLRFAAKDAAGKFRLGLPEVTLGVLPGTGGTQRLPRLIGKSRALDLMITGRLISPDEALQMGLVDRVWPQSEFWAKTMEYAQNLANGPTRAISLIKRSVQEGFEMPLAAALALERELQNRLFVTKDAQEGLGAFVEKRKPQFKGE
ncbi:MAG: enoyl-CoA hydratase/isomerase family protein [Candidatus Bipolaricaulota bacterium]|nr:enoyl-CoA hydratase/isomerase family protein [Candidatus Bipolaricaulota bacterium]MDW8329172.1 enoyl-CoA hydratase/isomerase family protein [Candidatus Bipolaricaulota bacterium]